MRFIDCHTHAHFAAFKDDYKEVIGRALHNGVWVVNVGTQKDTSKRGVEVAHEFESGVFATIGLHPTHTNKSFHDAKELGDTEDAKGFTSRGEDFDADYYLALAKDPKVVAIGECGLDYYRIDSSTSSEQANIKARQKAAFEAHIAVAHDSGKPLMIHCRDAFKDVIDILRGSKAVLPATPGVIHFFTGTPEDAKALLDLGFAFTFGGAITFARNYDETIKMLPLSALMSETDAPYVTPVPHRGKRNEPAYVVEVVKKLAEIRGVSADEMKEAIWQNAGRVLGIKGS